MSLPSDAVESLLAGYPAEVQAVAAAARDLLRRVLPDIEEAVDMRGIVGYRYGPGYKGLVCTLILSRAGVKLGIVRGAELSDPQGLMRGAGKVHRHVPLRRAADLSQAGLKPLLEQALAAWRKRTAASVREKGGSR